jgi:hypothetical protein
MAHDDGRDAASGASVVAVNVASADSAGLHAHEEVAGAQGWDGHIGQLELLLVDEQQGFHRSPKLKKDS